ncbi:MAG: hypothetical protein V4438_00730 [Patescibacteria group bacterium]
MRFYANLISIAALALLPWWGSAFVLVAFAVMFDFAEIILYGLVLDLLFGVPGTIFGAYGFIIFAAAIYALSVWIRPYLKQV